MGYDAEVLFLYGIPFKVDKEQNNNDFGWLVELMVPEIVKEYGVDDAWSCLDRKPYTDGYYLLNFFTK